jgi:hypothetical protein
MSAIPLLICAALQAQQPATSGSISGRIVPEFTGIPVTLSGYTYDEDGQIKLLNVAQARTSIEIGKFGEYRFDKVQPGEYYLYVNYPTAIAAKQRTFEPSYYPAGQTLATASRIVVGSGQHVQLPDLTLVSFVPSSTRIRLVNATGAPAAVKKCVTVAYKLRGSAKHEGDTPSRLPSRSVEIPFDLDKATLNGTVCGPTEATNFSAPALPSGTYDVYAGWLGDNGEVEGALASFEVRDVDREVDVVVSRARLTGRIVIEEGDGTLRAAGGLQFELRPKMLGPAQRGETLADGSVERDGVGANDYDVEFLNLPANAYVARLLEGDRDVLKEGLEVRSTSVHIDGLVSLAGGAVQGTVVTPKGEKAVRAVVALVPDPRLEARHLYRTATTDKNGTFAVRGVVPGAYQIFAWSKLNGAAYKNAEFMAPYAARGMPVTVERNGKVVVEAQLLDE